MKLSISVPKGYMHGAYYVKATLENEEINAYQAWPISFVIPSLPKRTIHTTPEFVVAAYSDGEVHLNGIFKNNLFESHVYTNGIPESENPTSINVVEEQLKTSIESAVSVSLSMYKTAQAFIKK